MKEYEKPIAELVEFQVNEAIMSMKLSLDGDAEFGSENVEDW